MASSESPSTTKKCKFCQTDIDVKASICPNCKKPQKAANPILTFIIFLVLVFLICSASSLAGLFKVANKVSDTINQSETKDADSWKASYKMNEDVYVGNITWKVLSAKNLGGKLKTKYPSFDKDCVANSGKFIKVSFKVKNNDKEMRTVTDVNLVDDQMRKFITSSEISNCVEDSIFILDNINPGIEKTYTAVYEVPNDAKNLKVKAGDLDLLSSEYKYIALGF